MINIQAENLIELWMHNSIGGKEDFDVLTIEFLETLNQNVSIYEVLQDTINAAAEKASEFPDDIALQLSYKAFNSSLEYQLQFWKNMVGA